MPGKAKEPEYQQNFEVIIREMGDAQLRDVLRKRNLYQADAARAAINEAIKREIISSESDLHSPEFRHEPLKPRLFPKIESAKNRYRIRKSLARGLLLAGILPTIWGMVRFNAGFTAEGILITTFGIGWMSLSAALIRKFQKTVVQFLFVLALLSVIYTVQRLVEMSRLVFMDLFIIAVLYLLIAYGLLFLYRLRD